MGLTPNQMVQPIVAGKEPGMYMITATNQLVYIGDQADIIWYDSEILPTVITAGQEFRMFFNGNFTTPPAATKIKGLHYNVPEWGKVPQQWDITVWQIGFSVQVETTPPAFVPADDMNLILNGGYMRLVTGSMKDECDGQLIDFPSGRGIGGVLGVDGNAVPVEVGLLSNGTPAPGAIGKREVPIPMWSGLNYEVVVRFPAAITLRAMPVKRLRCELTVKRGVPVR